MVGRMYGNEPTTDASLDAIATMVVSVRLEMDTSPSLRLTKTVDSEWEAVDRLVRSETGLRAMPVRSERISCSPTGPQAAGEAAHHWQCGISDQVLSAVTTRKRVHRFSSNTRCCLPLVDVMLSMFGFTP
jgi:hypothetical protein